MAALVVDHEHHGRARAHLSPRTRVPAMVLAETFAQLRRTFGQPALVAAAVLETWTSSPARILATSGSTLASVLSRAVELDLGGNVHDALVAQVCLDHDVGLVTLDRRQHTLALALGTDSTYLLA